MFLWWSGKNRYTLARKLWFIHCTHQKLHLQMSFSLQNFLNGKNFSSLNCKRCLELFFAQEIEALGRRNYKVAWKMGEGSGMKWWIRCSIKFLDENEKCALYFYLKTKRSFIPTQYMYITDTLCCIVVINITL